MKTFKLLGLLAILFTFAACGDDDAPVSPTFENAFTVDATTHVLNGLAIGGDDPFDQGVPDSLYSILLLNDEFSLSGDTLLVGTGTGVSFFFKSNTTDGLPDGVYNVVDDIDTSGLIVGVGYTVDGPPGDLIFGDDGLESGTVTVGTDGARRTVVFNGTGFDGEVVTGSYSGELRIQ